MNSLLAMPLVVPMCTAALCMVAWNKLTLQRVVCGVGSLLLVVVATVLFLRVLHEGPLVFTAGGWKPPFGIVLYADLASALMVLAASLVGLISVGQTLIDQPRASERFGVYALMPVLMMGVCGSFLAGDLFNLFVWFEVLLISSFVLLAMGNERPQLEGAMKYVVLNLIASSLFLSALGLLYGTLGSLNMADLALKVGASHNPGFLTTLSVLFLISFSVKAGLFPFAFWLPASYHTPSPTVSALFGALLTKVGVFAILRTFTLIFVTDPVFTSNMLMVFACLTMVVGGVAALAQDNVRRLLSFVLMSHIGTLVFGVALGTPLGIQGMLVYMVHEMFALSGLYLVSGLLESRQGMALLSRMGGEYSASPLLAALFLLPALAMVGVPPLSGFYGKVALLQAGGVSVPTVVLLVSSFLTLLAMVKIWNMAFWRANPDGRVLGRLSVNSVPAFCAVFLGLMLAVFANSVTVVGKSAAEELSDRSVAIRHVLGRER